MANYISVHFYDMDCEWSNDSILSQYFYVKLQNLKKKQDSNRIIHRTIYPQKTELT